MTKMNSSEKECRMEPSVDQRTDKLKIVLDHADNTYCSSHTIHGTIYFPENYAEIRGVFFRFIGKEKCCWTELFVPESKPKDEAKKETVHSKYYGEEEHLAPVTYIIGSKSGDFFTPERSYRFSFELKSNLPSTFRGECGEIKYKMKFVVVKRWNNKKNKMSLNIIRTVNLNLLPETWQPFEKQLTKNYGCLTNFKPISLHVMLPKSGFAFGDKIPITVTVTNSSKINVDMVKYYLNQIIEYHSTAPAERIKTETKRLLKKKADGVCKKSEQTFDLVIDVPENILPSQDNTTSRLILIKYEVKVKAKIGGMHKNLVVDAPIIIGTIPHSTNDRPIIIRHPSNLPIDQPVIFRMSSGSEVLSPSDVRSIMSNLSLELNSPQNQSNRSSIQSYVFPISPMTFGSPSVGSQYNRFSNSRPNSYVTPPCQPTAPPLDVNANSPVQSNSQLIPPSYEEACYGIPLISLANSPTSKTIQENDEKNDEKKEYQNDLSK